MRPPMSRQTGTFPRQSRSLATCGSLMQHASLKPSMRFSNPGIKSLYTWPQSKHITPTSTTAPGLCGSRSPSCEAHEQPITRLPMLSTFSTHALLGNKWWIFDLWHHYLMFLAHSL